MFIYVLQQRPSWISDNCKNYTLCRKQYNEHSKQEFFHMAEMQLTVGPVGLRGQNFRGSGKWRLCVRPNDRQTFSLLGAVKNQISVGPGYLLDL